MTRVRFRRGLLAGPGALLVAALLMLALVAACSSSARTAAVATPSEPAAAGGGPTGTSTPTPTTTPAPDSSEPTATASPAPGTGSPTAQASPVFIDEPCDPATPGPEQAINGLSLFCAANGSGPAAWATQLPPSPSPSPRSPGGSCSASDTGKYARSAQGRPLECVKDPDGRYRWVDTS